MADEGDIQCYKYCTNSHDKKPKNTGIRSGIKFHCGLSGRPFHVSTITASLPHSWAHLASVWKTMGMRRLMASICFLWRMGEIGSVLVASISIFVSKPPFSSTRRSKVLLRKRQHWEMGAKIDISSWWGLPNDLALSSKRTIESAWSEKIS